MGSCRKVENGPVLREREMSEGRCHWIQHQDIIGNTADRSLSEWFK